MDKILPKVLYRSIKKSDLDLYLTDPEKVKFLEGRYFKEFEGLKDYKYQKDVQYLHFFDSLPLAKGYAQDSTKNGKDKTEHIVCAFEFSDNSFLNDCKRKCKFAYDRKGGKQDLFAALGGVYYTVYDEYIMPMDLFKQMCVSVRPIERDKRNAPNAFAVINSDELDFYISNMQRANGLEYLENSYKDSYLSRLVSEGRIKPKYQGLPSALKEYAESDDIRAVRFFGTEAEAEKAKNNHFDLVTVTSRGDYDMIQAMNMSYASGKTVVPFYVAPQILEKFKVEGTGREEYVVPFKHLSEANYYEVGCDWLEDSQEKSGNKPQMGE